MLSTSIVVLNLYHPHTHTHTICYPGDITEKGYEKKKAKLLAPYLSNRQGE